MNEVLLLWSIGMSILVGYLIYVLLRLRQTMDEQQALIDAYRQRDADEGRISGSGPLAWPWPTTPKGSGR